MADVNISKYTTQVVREGSRPATPGFVVSEGQDPVNPPGTNNYVPYSGATANVELGEFGLESGFVTLDTTPTNIPTEQGGIYWDDSKSTAALIMNGTLQHIGQDTFFYVKNSSGSSIAKGTAVRFDGTDGGSGHLLIAPFLADGTYPSTYFMGVTAEAIGNGEFGQVMHFGELSGINTSGFTAGALLYASTTSAGGFQTTAPVAPNNIVLIAAAVNSKNNGDIIVRPTYGSNINQDEGVKITTPTTGDLLQLQAGGLWENKTLAQVIGSAYVPSTRTITINGTTQDLSANRTYNVGDMLLDTIQTVTARKDYNNNTLQLVVNGTSQKTVLTNSSIDTGSYSLAINFFGFNASNNLYFSKGGNNNGIFAFNNADTRTYTLKDASGTLAFTSDIPANPVGGTGTTNYLPKFTGTSTIGNSNLINDASGNLGLGVTPSAWDSSYRVLQNTGGSLIGASGELQLWQNAFFNGTSSIYIASSTATRYNMTSGQHRWFNAPSGTAGNAISWTQAMTLTSGGNVLIGTTTDAGTKLNIVGAIRLKNTDGDTGFDLNENGSAALIRQRNNRPLVLYTNNAERMRITSSGNVLIGTTTDNGAKLQVNGTGTFTSSVIAVSAGLNGSIANSGDAAILTIKQTSTSYNNGIYLERGGERNGYHIYIGGASDCLVFRRNYFGTQSDVMSLSREGNVLIGSTTNGSSKLRIVGLPTSSAGLSSGDVWNDSGTLKIA